LRKPFKNPYFKSFRGWVPPGPKARELTLFCCYLVFRAQ
jgi:hypothetical protein